jgi:hypothetical protein
VSFSSRIHVFLPPSPCPFGKCRSFDQQEPGREKKEARCDERRMKTCRNFESWKASQSSNRHRWNSTSDSQKGSLLAIGEVVPASTNSHAELVSAAPFIAACGASCFASRVPSLSRNIPLGVWAWNSSANTILLHGVPTVKRPSPESPGLAKAFIL